MPAAKPAKKKSAAASPVTGKADFAEVFTALRELLGPFSKEVAVQTDKPGDFHTHVPSILHRGKPLYFAGIKTGKNYVSFHLLPLYYSPELLKGMSPALNKRKQGKACFNFTSVNQECFAELSRLMAAGLKIFKTEKFRQSIQKLQ
jgi:hypothetical protein